MGGLHIGSHHGNPVRIQNTAGQPSLPFSQVPPMAKLVLMLVIVLCTATFPVGWYAWHLGLGLFLVFVAVAGRLSWRQLFLRLAVLAPFVVGVSLASALQSGAGIGWRAVALRCGLCVMTVTIFSSVTPIGSLPSLLRRLKVPALLVTTLALMHRYLHVLADESERMRRARASRTLRKGRVFVWTVSAELVGRLFVRASERAERIYLAMCARGWK